MTPEDLETIKENMFELQDIIQTNEWHINHLQSFNEPHPKKNGVLTALHEQNEVAQNILQDYRSLVDEIKHDSYLAFIER
jgi:hypothetical protein